MACARTIWRSFFALGFARHVWRRAQAARAGTLVILLSALLALPVAPAIAASPTSIKATLAVTTNDGYARLVFSANEYIEASTKVSGHVLIITFKQPLDVAVDRLPELAADYVGAARR